MTKTRNATKKEEIELEYVRWLGQRNRRKHGRKWYALFTDGTETEVNKVIKQIQNSYDFVVAVETFKSKWYGETREVYLLYVIRKEYRSLTQRGII
jgi:hypothetical protein